MNLRISDMVGEYAITAEDGDLVFQPVHEALVTGEEVAIDFEGVAVFASPFFNAAIGRLLEDIPQETLRERLHLRNLSHDGSDVLQRVIENAKSFYQDPRRGRPSRMRSIGQRVRKSSHERGSRGDRHRA